MVSRMAGEQRIAIVGSGESIAAHGDRPLDERWIARTFDRSY
jgi:hypothetical protein